MAALPLIVASCIGVAPAAFAADTRAPARISNSAVSRSSRRTAQWRAVDPSICAALTSASCRNKDRTAAVSPVMAASASSLVAPLRPATAITTPTQHTTTCLLPILLFRQEPIVTVETIFITLA